MKGQEIERVSSVRSKESIFCRINTFDGRRGDTNKRARAPFIAASRIIRPNSIPMLVAIIVMMLTIAMEWHAAL